MEILRTYFEGTYVPFKNYEKLKDPKMTIKGFAHVT